MQYSLLHLLVVCVCCSQILLLLKNKDAVLNEKQPRFSFMTNLCRMTILNTVMNVKYQIIF